MTATPKDRAALVELMARTQCRRRCARAQCAFSKGCLMEESELQEMWWWSDCENILDALDAAGVTDLSAYRKDQT